MVLYTACMDPWKKFNNPIHRVFPLNRLIILISSCINVSCNIFLSVYLSGKTQTNTAIREVDKKKNRKRNLIPANTRLYVVFWLSVTIFLAAYIYESEKLDSGTWAFLTNTYVDANHCISSPLIIFFGSKDAQKLFSQFIPNGVVRL